MSADMNIDDVEPVNEVKEKSTDTLPWIEKYRPKSLDDLLSHQEIIQTIGRMMDTNQLPHLLFYGPAGTGKTSTILACARKLNGPHYASMILELNASVDNGINIIREQVPSLNIYFFSSSLDIHTYTQFIALHIFSLFHIHVYFSKTYIYI